MRRKRNELAGKTPAELDKVATDWLKRHDPQPKQKHNLDEVIEWSLSPVAEEVHGDDDAREIASMFAEFSGGDRVFDFYSGLAAEDERGLEARREYMRRTRQHDPSKRRRWRASEKQKRREKRAAAVTSTRVDDIAERSTVLATLRERAHQRRRRRKSRIRKENERQTAFNF